MPTSFSSFALYQKPSHNFGHSSHNQNFLSMAEQQQINRPITGSNGILNGGQFRLSHPNHISAFKKTPNYQTMFPSQHLLQQQQQQQSQQRVPKSNTYSSLLIEASKAAALSSSEQNQMIAFEQYQNNELVKKQQIIQALYLKQQQLQQQQLIQQMQLQQQQYLRIPKSNTFDCFINSTSTSTGASATATNSNMNVMMNMSNESLSPITELNITQNQRL
jgi:hypothetical protein